MPLYAARQDGVVVSVSRRTRLAVEAQKLRATDEAGLLSYSRVNRRCSISVPWVCSTTHRRVTGTNPGLVSVRLTCSTSMPRTAPWIATSSLNPASTHALVTVGA
jgi:hypothetical protein